MYSCVGPFNSGLNTLAIFPTLSISSLPQTSSTLAGVTFVLAFFFAIPAFYYSSLDRLDHSTTCVMSGDESSLSFRPMQFLGLPNKEAVRGDATPLVLKNLNSDELMVRANQQRLPRCPSTCNWCRRVLRLGQYPDEEQLVDLMVLVDSSGHACHAS